jgi:hypothetical protein
MPPTTTTKITTRRRGQQGPGGIRGGKLDRDDNRSKSDIEDENAGQNVTRILGIVAIFVILLIGYRGVLMNNNNSLQEDEDNNVAIINEDSNTNTIINKDDSNNNNNIDDNSNNKQVMMESYPVELLRDDNGTRSVKDIEADDESVKEEELLEKQSAKAYQEELQQQHKQQQQHTIIPPNPDQELKQQQTKQSKSSSSNSDDDSDDSDNDNPKQHQQHQQTSSSTPNPKKRVPSLGNLLFEDGLLYEQASTIELHPEAGQPFKGMWDLLTSHEEYYKKNPHKRYVPRLGETISRQTFHRVFRITSTPVIMSFDHARALGFLTQQQTMEELREKHPYDPEKDSSLTYNPSSGRKTKLDLGPAVYAISKDAKLEKIGVGVRNFPRNLQLSSKNMASLQVSRPPYIQKKRFQPASMWFGTSSSPTKFHHDCCDNFVMMIAGTKRWFLAPVTDWRRLQPIRCEGDHQSLCWATVAYPPKPKDDREKKIVESLNSVVIDLHPGEMLYLPAGWFHYIDNLGPTVMLNHWTFGCENVGMQLEQDPSRKDRSDFRNCPAAATAERLWREKEDKNCPVCT